MKNQNISLFKVLFLIVFLALFQNSDILAQQVVDANISSVNGYVPNNVCIDYLEPTNIDVAGEMLINEARLEALGENQDGYALWELTNFTSTEQLSLNLFVIENNSNTTVGYSLRIFNNTISLEFWGGDFVVPLLSDPSWSVNSEIKIERKDGVINWYIDDVIVYTHLNADQRALFANFAVSNVGENLAVDPNIYFTFPNQISNNPPTGNQCPTPTNVALSGIPSSVDLQSGSIENLNDGIMDHTSEVLFQKILL